LARFGVRSRRQARLRSRERRAELAREAAGEAPQSSLSIFAVSDGRPARTLRELVELREFRFDDEEHRRLLREGDLDELDSLPKGAVLREVAAMYRGDFTSGAEAAGLAYRFEELVRWVP
jgi:hypothetical protein